MTYRVLALTAMMCVANANAHDLENESLRLQVDKDGRVTVHDKRNGTAWIQAVPKNGSIPKVESVRASTKGINVQLKWRIPLICRWSLAGPDSVQARLESREKGAPIPKKAGRVLYPPPFYASGVADFAAVCEDEGVLYRTADTDPESDRIRYTAGSMGRSRSMPWSGLLDGDLSAGMMTLVDTPFYAVEKMAVCGTPDGRRSLPTLFWEAGRENTIDPRSVRFHVFTSGGYVAMAKRFRAERIAAGRFRTLAEKAQDVPAIGKLKGALDMWIFRTKQNPLTAADVERIHSLGFEKVLLQVIAGVHPKPTDGFTPDAIEKAHGYGYLVGQYHNYSWVMEHSWKRDPARKALGIRGRDGYEPQHSLWGTNLKHCPAVLVAQLRSVAVNERDSGYDALFTDCTTAGGSVMDCYDPNHPLTRVAAAKKLGESLRAVSGLGLVIGSERGFWWAAADCHYFEGIETIIRYFQIFSRESASQHHVGPFHIERPADYDRYMLAFNYGPQNRLPLFQLVFHDAVVCMRRWNDHYGRDADLWRLNDLMSIAYGTPPIVKFREGDHTPHILKDDFASVRDDYMRTCRDVCGWHEKIGFDEMIDHRFLTKNRLVQETRFSSGHTVVVNFGSAAWEDQRGFQVPSMAFHTFASKPQGDSDMGTTRKPSRRAFLTTSAGALAGAGLMAGSAPSDAGANEKAFGPGDRRTRNRVGAVAYGYQYSIGLFSYKDRPGEKFDAVKFVEANHAAGGEVAQLYHSMIRDLDEDGLKRLRRRAEELDVLLEVHGGGALGKWSKFEDTMQRAAALGCKVVGCTFGMLMRPDKIATLDAWDEHTKQCEARLRELAPLAKSLGLTIGVENHLDFTVEELRDLIKRVNSPNVGVIFDVGNTIGTLDDPTEAADILGPHIVATHYKDFAIEEVARGFRFCMVPLGCGSLRLPEITERLLKHVDSEMGMSIEMMNGQHFEVNWLEDRFWTAYRNKTARQVAATLRHIRGKAININEFKLVEEVDKLRHEEHITFEQDRMAGCIAYLKGVLDELRL